MTKSFFYLLISLIELSSVVAMAFYIFTRTRYYRRLLENRFNYKNQIILILFVGLVSIYGTLNGVSVGDGIANVRDLGPMIGGLLGGPIVGFCSGLIGAAYRWFFGGPIRTPSCFATVLAGLICGIIAKRYNYKLLSPLKTALLAFIIEMVHMILVLSFSESFSQALRVVQAVTIPVTIANVYGLSLFSLILANDKKEQEIIAKNQKLELENTIKNQSLELEKQKRKLHQQKIEFWTEKSQRLEVENTLKTQTLDMEKQKMQLHQQKIDFFMNLTHEIRTPLTHIRINLDQYLKEVDENEKLLTIEQGIEKLLRDMNNYFAIEALERGKIQYNHSQIISLSDHIDEIITTYKTIAQMKKIYLTSYVDKCSYIQADPAAIDRIAYNLIDNAIKYTSEKGKIKLEVKRQIDTVIFRVRDTGIGIAAENITKLGLPYYQISHEKSNTQGLGLGLHIVQDIIKSLNANIEIESVEGKGSVFTVKFTRAHPPQDALLVKNETAEKLAHRSCPVNIQDIELQDSELNAELPSLLLVEDDKRLLNSFYYRFKNQFNLFFAQNGKVALKKLDKLPRLPDIIISDIMMDQMDGYDLLTEVSNNKEYNNIPFIFLTAVANLEREIFGLSRGAVDYIIKPFTFEVIEAKIHSLINHKAKQKEKNVKDFCQGLEHVLKEQINPKTQCEKAAELCQKKGLKKPFIEVAKLMAQGCSVPQIAAQLKTPKKTIESRKTIIFNKFGSNTTAQFFAKINE